MQSAVLHMKCVGRAGRAPQQLTESPFKYLKAIMGICEAHIQQTYKSSVIGEILSQTYRSVWWWTHNYTLP